MSLMTIIGFVGTILLAYLFNLIRIRKNIKSNLKFFVVKQSFFTTFVDFTILLSASFAINFHTSIIFFTLVMPPLVATRLK
jgi:hypothetical protein